jgi:hypothetical protein
MSPMKRVMLIQPSGARFEPARLAVRHGLARLPDVELVQVIDAPVGGDIVGWLLESLETADLILADITEANPNVLYELGFAHGVRRPVIVMAASPTMVPFDVAAVPFLHYTENPDGIVRLTADVARGVEAALADPAPYRRRPTTRIDVNRVFVSYSHQDADVLERLAIHLQPLVMQGLLDVWSDTRIKAGKHWQQEIEDALHRTRIGILLISADFLASEFIVKNELPPLLTSAEERGTTLIPMIVSPCRYSRDAELRRLQAINDPKHSFRALSRVEQEALLDRIALAVEEAMRPLK